jgi:hypothetical protein
MRFQLDEVRRIACDVARIENAMVEVIGVTPTGRGSNYAEVLMLALDSTTPPRRRTIDITRTGSESDLRAEFAAKLHREPADLSSPGQ